MRAVFWLAALWLASCGSARVNLDPPSEEAPHRAALAGVTVRNTTPFALTIAFRTAVPPLQEVGIGTVPALGTARMAPVPAGEPIILVARRETGAEYRIAARSFPLEDDWIWEIPEAAVFQMPEPRR